MVLKINIKWALDEKKIICISNIPWLMWSCRSDYLLNKDFIIFCSLKIIWRVNLQKPINATLKRNELIAANYSPHIARSEP